MNINSRSHIIIPDANVCLAYSVNHKYRTHNKKTVHVQIPSSEPVEYYLTPEIPKRSIYVIRAIDLETRRMMDKVLRDAVRRAGLLVRTRKILMAPSLSRLYSLYDTISPSYYELIPDACMFYIDIWKDSVSYGKRWIVESVFSVLKRIFGEYVMAHKRQNMVKELELKVALYNQFVSA